VNRQSRALLTLLIVAAVVIPYWLLTRDESRPTAGISLGRPAEPIPTRGGAVVASTRTDPRSFNRIVHSQIATEMMSMLTQGKLVRINRETQQVEPWLAERWETSGDGRTFTLTLRENLKWSDQTPFTSADVLFTFEALYAAGAQSTLTSALSPSGKPLAVSAPDVRTVVITFSDVFAPGIRILDNLPMFPRHKLEAAFKAGNFLKSWTADTPPADMVSLGPFILEEYRPAERLVFTRNPHYWRSDERGVQLPYLDRLTLQLIPDYQAEIVRLQSGQTDFMQEGLAPADLATFRPLEQQGRIRLEELGVSLNADTMVMNLRPDRWAKDPRAAWFNRTQFRQAMSHAVDREALADAAAVPIHGPITPGNQDWFWASVPRYEFSREKAKGLLTELGLTNRDDDEWLEDAAGNEARFTALVFRGNVILERTAGVVREDLRQIGIALDVVPLEPNSIQQRIFAGDFDAAFINFTATDTDPAISKDFWMSSGGSHFWNISQKSPATDWERQIDELMTKQYSTTDTAERKRLFNEVQRLFAENLPMLYFAAPRVYIATSSRMVNLRPSVTRPQLLWSADTLAVRDAGTTQ
jgi:peptide/nickel transport system substrate-binding protein